MKAMVVYDSVFGNTEKVAQAMGAALEAQAEVSVLKVGDVPPEFWTGLDALIVGSPTRAFSPTPAVKAWLRGLPSGSLDGVKVVHSWEHSRENEHRTLSAEEIADADDGALVGEKPDLPTNTNTRS